MVTLFFLFLRLQSLLFSHKTYVPCFESLTHLFLLYVCNFIFVAYTLIYIAQTNFFLAVYRQVDELLSTQ
ncbi:MAG: hypothetical protein CMF38_07445 [Legionellaceae bacterium]|nr:hypothetical protein [Legionellaceae bacterium]